MQRIRRMESVPWEAVITGIIGIFSTAAAGVGVWWKTTRAGKTKRFEQESATEQTKIKTNADSELQVLSLFHERIESLEVHNRDQDSRIHTLVGENAELRATVNLLREQNELLREQNAQLIDQNQELQIEKELLKEALKAKL